MIILKGMKENNKQGFIIFQNTETSSLVEIPIDLVYLNIIRTHLSKIIHKPSLLNLESEIEEDEES